MAHITALFSYLYQERINLCQILIYGALSAYVLSGAAIVLNQNRFSTNLTRLRSALRLYFVLFISSIVVFGIARFVGTGEIGGTSLAVLFLLGLTIQLQIQILNDPRLQQKETHRFMDQMDAIRHWVFIFLGVALLIVLNSSLSALLLFIAQKEKFSELNKDLILWLRAPIAIYGAQLIGESLRTIFLRFQFRAKPLNDENDELFKSIMGVAGKYHIQIKKIFLINLDKYNYNLVLGHKSNLFLNRNIKAVLTDQEFEFLVVQGLLDKKLKLERQRLVHFTIFAVGLFLPYFLLGQGLDYIVPNIWAVTIWQFLFIGLFLIQSLLKRDINSLQFALKCHAACRLVKISGHEMAEIYRKLNVLNQVDSGPQVVFGLPQPPSFGGAKEKYLRRVQENLKDHLKPLTTSAQVLTASTAFLLLSSFFILGPRYKLRAAAERGDVQVVTQMLKQGQSPNSVDILSNVTPTPLLAATQAGQIEVVKILLSHGANPNQKVPLPFSPLIFAAKGGNLEMVQLLINSGARVNYHGYKGLTALMWAALFNRKEIADYLIAHGASVNARSFHKSTALMIAIQAGSLDVAKTLILADADVRLLDADKDSALGLAKKKKVPILISLVQSAEKKIRRAPASQ
jgi:uncharacterized protein